MKKLPASTIKRVAELAQWEGSRILDHFLPGGKRRGKEYVVKHPHRDDQHAGSLSVEVASGKGGDFATGEGWGDYVGLVAFAQRCADQSEAAVVLAAYLGIDLTRIGAVPPTPTSSSHTTKSKPSATVAMPFPKDTPPPQAHPKRGKPDHRYNYRDAEGNVLCQVCRWEAKGDERKYFSPLIWTGTEYRWQAPPVPRQLYGLDLLADRPDADVAVVEGERSADAVADLMSGHVPVTWMNGSQSADKADWGPCKGKHVVIWPDADDAGTQAALTAAKGLRKAGAASVKFVNRDLYAKHKVGKSGGLVARSGELPKGWDAADALAEGWTDTTVAELLKMDDALLDDLKTPSGKEGVFSGSAPAPLNDGDTDYISNDTGLYFVERKDGEARNIRICGPLAIPALSSYAGGDGYGPLIEFTDRDGRKRAEVIPYKLFLGQGFDGIKMLVDMGLEVEPTTKALDLLRRYIVGAKPTGRAERVTTTGWHGRYFAFPDGAVGDGDKVLLYDGSRRALGVYGTAGTLQQWQANIASKAAGNPMLQLVLSLSFAGPLLKPLGEAGFALHLVGDSSTGKSSALAAAGATWGPTDEQVRSWRSTSNALEGTCMLSNHALLVLDEFRELDPKEATAVTYMLSNGKGKQRMHHAGGLRDAVDWAITILSSGELGLGDALASVGQKVFQGQRTRFIELDSDAGAGDGMWDDTHGMVERGKGFSDALKKAAAKYYGTAGRAFVAQCVKHYDMLAPTWRNFQHDFARDFKPDNAGGQVLRVMTAFALIGFAGKMATRWEIVPWQPDDATAAAGAMFRKWLLDRPTTGNGEEYQILAHVRALMERSWKSRFDDWHRIVSEGAGGKNGDTFGDLSRAPTVLEPLGFRRPDELGGFRFYIFRQRFEEEFGKKGGFKARRVAAVLNAHGMLLTDADATTKKETLPNGDPRSYCLLGNKLWGQGEEP